MKNNMITATIKGKWMLHPHYNVPGIEHTNGLLFTVLDDDFTKFVFIDKCYNIIELKYYNKILNLRDSDKIINEFDQCKNVVYINDGYYEICDFQEFEEFPPKNCLEKYVIFTFWFGNSYTINRDKQYKSLRKDSKCNVININENNIHLLKYPLHKSFKYLSSIHKGDYLRCYCMYYYGGGYSDIKATSGSWVECFDELIDEPRLYMIGHINDCLPNEHSAGETYENRLLLELKAIEKTLPGVGFFIFKRDTNLVKEWFLELNNRLDIHYEKLKENPAKFDRESKSGSPVPRWEKGYKQETEYPIYWCYILCHIVLPIYLKYFKHIKLGIPRRNDKGKYK